MKNLYVMAEIKVHPNHIEEATGILKTLACNSITEPGCSIYQVLKSTVEDNIFTTFESWRSIEDERLHWQTEDLKATLEQLSPLLLENAIIKKYCNLSKK